MSDAADRTAASHARTVLLVACALTFALSLWDLFAAPAFRGDTGWEGQGNLSYTRVTYIKSGYPADRAGLRVGDTVFFGDTIAERSKRFGPWIVGHPIFVPEQRSGKHVSVTITPIATPRSDMWARTDFWTDMVLDIWMLVFAAIVAWRGVDQRARLLSCVLVLLVANDLLSGANDFGFASPWLWVTRTASVLQVPAGQLAIVVLALAASTFGRPVSTARRWLTYATYVAITICGVVQLITGVGALLPQLDSIGNVLASYNQAPSYWIWAIGWALGATCAFAAVPSAHSSERQQAAWLMVPFGIYCLTSAIVQAAWPFAGGPWTGAQTALNIATNAASFFTPALLTYAVLRRRLLDVNFVVNRAAVFAGVSFVVIGAFILAEWLLNKVFVDSSRTTNALIGLAIALALGLSLRFIHRFVDRFVDQLFFRTRHDHEQKLRSFAHEAAFITDYDTLLDDAVREVSTNSEAEHVAILVKDGGGHYDIVRGANGAASRVSENDRAVLKMRTWHAPVDLDSVETALEGAWAYPLISRGDLLGILVCGTKRDGQGYAPDESEALSSVAHGVGTALGALGRPSNDVTTEIGDLRTTMSKMNDALQTIIEEQRELRNQVVRLSYPNQNGGGPAI